MEGFNRDVLRRVDEGEIGGVEEVESPRAAFGAKDAPAFATVLNERRSVQEHEASEGRDKGVRR